MAKPVSEKMGVKEGTRAILVNAPPEAVEAIDLPPLTLAEVLRGNFDYIHFFAENLEALDDIFPKLKRHLKQTGMLWISWRKNGKLGTDLTLPKVIEIGYNAGLVESKTISINTTWSAIKFTHPKAGKVYQNSYGKLKS